MWSIHPDQIRPIVRPFARHRGGRTGGTDPAEGAAVQWGPIQHLGNLHDRASYRYYWSILQRAHATGVALPSRQPTGSLQAPPSQPSRKDRPDIAMAS
jgi:citrate lyase subunit beta/citryl-CoA lyase